MTRLQASAQQQSDGSPARAPWLPAVKGTKESGCLAMGSSMTTHGSTKGARYSMATSPSCRPSSPPGQKITKLAVTAVVDVPVYHVHRLVP